MNCTGCRESVNWVEYELYRVQGKCELGGICTVQGAGEVRTGWNMNCTGCRGSVNWVEYELYRVQGKCELGGI